MNTETQILHLPNPPLRGARGVFWLILILTTFFTCSPTRSALEEHSTIRIQLSKDWVQINTFLFHANGQTWIEFDSIYQVDTIGTHLQIIGLNPQIHGNTAEISPLTPLKLPTSSTN